MNILFLVFTFLSLFLFFNTALFKNTFSFSSEQKAICSYLKAKQGLQNKWESRKYKTYKQKAPSSSKTSAAAEKIPLPGKEKKGESSRLKKPLPLMAKWNLLPLLNLKEPNQVLARATANLLKNLYGHTSFWKKGLEQELVLSFQQKSQLPERFSDLFPAEVHLQEPFYQMLKGSNSYDIKQKKGYPPLKDFFCLSLDRAKTLYFPHASYQAIEALIGKDLALELGSKETKDNTPLSASDLSMLLSTHNHPLRIHDLEPLLDFSSPKVIKDQILYQDENAVCVKIDLPTP